MGCVLLFFLLTIHNDPSVKTKIYVLFNLFKQKNESV